MYLHKCPHPYHRAKKRQVIEKYAAIILAVSLVLLFLIGRFSVRGVEKYEEVNKALGEQIAQLEKTNNFLQKKQDFVDSENVISQQAEQSARRELAKLHDELSAATEQIAFYQRIVAPEKFTKGVYAQSFNISEDSGLGQKFQLVIVQGASTRRDVKGRVDIQIEGAQGNQMKALKFSEVSSKKRTSLPFSLRYYQVLSGEITLPAGFMPKQVIVKITASSSKSKPSVKRWLWSEVTTSL
ncbi:MAG: hypothetical protein A6F71_01215 [Cycloclasticus sp. symbiont of Poecilosclerida sp. M]|nr:MAG: hypothetical protein A6F71_01215 [Cycloclasticus sp. symbiont of Poecilosclerida sp. M]